MTCTFFGHRTVTKGIEPTLRSTLTDLIENHNVALFYVGNQGEFDAIVLRVLTDLARQYPIRYFVVLGKRDSNPIWFWRHLFCQYIVKNARNTQSIPALFASS